MKTQIKSRPQPQRLVEWPRYRPDLFICAVLSVVALSAFVLATATPGSAAPPDRPQKRDCSGLDKNERIACKHENVNAELYDLVDEATGDNGTLFTPTQKEHLKKARERAEKGRMRKRDSNEFREFGKKSKVQCAIREYEDPDCYDPLCDPDKQAFCDSVCEDPFPENDDPDLLCNKGNELCAEALNDGYGDDDGLCVQKGAQSKREPCLEVCDDAAVGSLEENYESGTTDDFEDSLDEVAMVLGETNSEIRARKQMMSSLAPIVSGQYTGSGACADLKKIADERLFSYADIQGTLAGANVAQGALQVCETVCDQTVVAVGFGANCASACMVLAIAAGVLETVTEAFELQDDYITSKELEAALGCLEQTDGQLSEVLVRQGNTEQELKIIKGLMLDVIELLNTPQGRRENFPLK